MAIAQFEADSSAPVEITADSMEWMHEERIAVARGNADAVQGRYTLHADVLTAYSRYGKKEYVQDLISQSGKQVWDLIQANATIYVCGDAGAMEPAVRAAFENLYRENTGQGAEDASAWMNELVLQNRYLVDVWASS